MIIKHWEAIGGGGFFETQVEVVEKEEIIEIDDDGDEAMAAGGLPKNGGKDDKIFGFNNFNDFKDKYFVGKEVQALHDKNRIVSIKQARAKYAKRYNHQQNGGAATQ